MLTLHNPDQSPFTGEFVDHIDRLKARQIGPTFIDSNPIRNAICLDGLLEKPPRSSSITSISEHKIKGSAVPIDGAVKIGPLTFEHDISFVHPLRNCRGPLVFLGFRSNERRIFHHPPVQRGVVDCDAALSHNLLQITIGNGVSDVEKHCV